MSLGGIVSLVHDPVHIVVDTGEGVWVASCAPQRGPEGGDTVNLSIFAEGTTRVTLERTPILGISIQEMSLLVFHYAHLDHKSIHKLRNTLFEVRMQ